MMSKNKSIKPFLIRMLMRKSMLVLLLCFVLLAAVGYVFFFKQPRAMPENIVVVSQGNVIDKVIAIGRIEPRQAIAVKAKISGTIAELFKEVGDWVEVGEPLARIRPTPTPSQLVRARRTLQEREVAEATAQAAVQRLSQLRKQGHVSQEEYEKAQERHETSVLQRQLAEEELQLLAQGFAEVAGQKVESLVVSPVAGYILERNVDYGAFVIPLTESLEGTNLFQIADMGDLVFRGQMSEIDIHKIQEGMPADITVAATNDRLRGMVRKIGLQALTPKLGERRNIFNVSFAVEIDALQNLPETPLRSGYSANAEIVVATAENVLILPEYALQFTPEGQPFVTLKGKPDEKRMIKTGISDGLNIEIRDGLALGDEVVVPTRAA